MSDEKGGDEGGGGGETEVEIDREDNFRAFWANAYAEVGPANTVMDFMLSLEGKITATAAFSSSLVGVQIDACMAAIGVEADAGKSFQVFNGLTARMKVADVEAVCNEAEAVLAEAENKVTAMDTKLSELKSTVQHLESGGAWLCGMAMMAKV